MIRLTIRRKRQGQDYEQEKKKTNNKNYKGGNNNLNNKRINKKIMPTTARKGKEQSWK